MWCLQLHLRRQNQVRLIFVDIIKQFIYLKYFFRMRFISSILSFAFIFIFPILNQAQSPQYLGSEITNGITTNGCAGSCIGPLDPANGKVCTTAGSGNHSLQTMTYNISVPPLNYASITVTTNNCNLTTSGLDSGDDLLVNGVTTGPYSANALVNYSGCLFNASSTDTKLIPVTLLANRRDETVTVVFSVSTSDPGGLCTALPITLKNFDLQYKSKNISLNWTTSSEVNNGVFEVERSLDAREFETIGEVKGAGTSNNDIDYIFVDESPIIGMNYYRIKQIDFDGKYSYSTTKGIMNKGLNRFTVESKISENIITIASDDTDLILSVCNSSGQEVLKFSNLQSYDEINLGNLLPGMYFLRIQSDNGSEVYKIFKI